MKPKYHRFMRRAFPSLIVVPAIVQLAAAATFDPDTAGNILVPSNFSSVNGQAFTIIADGGTGTSFSAVIENGVIFTGDAGLQDGMRVSVAGYTITNSGSLSGNDDGLFSSVDITLTNNNLIEGINSEGVRASGGATSITNNAGATIRGGDDGIFLDTDGGTVNNSGQIIGLGNSYGINAYDNLVVVNRGLISGGASGIDAEVQAHVSNYSDITGTDSGVDLGFNGYIENITTIIGGSVTDAGSITSSTGDAVVAAAGANIVNGIAGVIEGNGDGADLGTDSFLTNTGGEITGINGYGVIAGSGASILNDNDVTGDGSFYQGQITGNIDGVSVGASSNIDNRGSIEGLNGNGVTIGDGVGIASTYSVNNTGEITGATNGIAGGTGTVIYTDGDITGTNGSGVTAGAGLNLQVDNDGDVSGNVGVTTTGGGASIGIEGSVRGTGGTALALGNTAGAGNSSIGLDGGEIDGDIIATGTGNSLNSSDGTVYGDISGVQQILVNPGDYLEIFGDISTPATITVGVSGDLSGSGTWQADVNLADNSAIYAALDNDYSAGVLDIAGNVNHAVGSHTYTAIKALQTITNNGTDAGLIRSTSGVYDATNATVDVASYNGEALRDGTYTIVEDAGGTIFGGGNVIEYYGREDAVLALYFAGSRINGAGSLVLDIDHGYGFLPGLSDNQQSAGGALDSFMASESGLGDGLSNDIALRSIIGELDYQDLDEVQNFLGTLVAPAEAALALTQSVVNSNYRINRLVQEHNAVARSSGGIVSVPVGMSAKDAPAAPAPVAGGRGNVWGSFSYDWQDYEGDDDGANDFDGEVASFTAGFDYRVAPNLILGFLLDGSKADLDGSGQATDIDSFRATIYGSWGSSTGLYSDFLIGYGDHDNDFTDATSIQALATIGYAMGDERFKHGPYAGLEYQNVDVDGFGVDNLLPIEVDGYEIDSFRGLIGYRVNANLGRFRPYASISYAHEFEDGKNHTDSSFGAASFRVEGGEQGSAILLTAGTGISLTSALTLDLGYRGEICVDSEGLDSHGGNIGLNWNF